MGLKCLEAEDKMEDVLNLPCTSLGEKENVLCQYGFSFECIHISLIKRKEVIEFRSRVNVYVVIKSYFSKLGCDQE